MIGQLLIQFGPTVAAGFQKLFTTANPTQDDWDKLFAMAQKPWEDRKPPTA